MGTPFEHLGYGGYQFRIFHCFYGWFGKTEASSHYIRIKRDFAPMEICRLFIGNPGNAAARHSRRSFLQALFVEQNPKRNRSELQRFSLFFIRRASESFVYQKQTDEMVCSKNQFEIGRASCRERV